MLSTLLYTWSNYEMVYTAANTYVSSTGSTLRAVFVIITALCTIIATAIYDYFTAMSVWYALHFSPYLSVHFMNLSNYPYYFAGGFVCLCCAGSAGLLAGTIYWAHKMALAAEEREM